MDLLNRSIKYYIWEIYRAINCGNLFVIFIEQLNIINKNGCWLKKEFFDKVY